MSNILKWSLYGINVLQQIFNHFIFPSNAIISVFHIQLHVAAANAYVEVLEFLLENDADVDVVDKDGWKPIHAAACWGNVSF